MVGHFLLYIDSVKIFVYKRMDNYVKGRKL